MGKIPWTPQPKQKLALESKADELFYGGAAGGGKTDLLLGLAGLQHTRSIIFRRTYPNLRSIIERSREIYTGYGELNQSLHFWRLGVRMIEMGALQYEHNKQNYQGQPHDLYCWDEITEFTESQFRFVNAWNRTTVKGQRTRIVATGNPPNAQEGQWVKRYWAAWLDPKHRNPAKEGELRWYWFNGERDEELESGEPFKSNGKMVYPRSRTFIAAKVTDNEILMETDPNYVGKLQALPEPLRSQLLYGDFSIGETDDAWQLIPSSWVYAAVERGKKGIPTFHNEYGDLKQVPLTSLGVDVAFGGDDETIICELYDNYIAPLHCYPGKQTRGGGEIVSLIMNVWRTGAPIGYDALSWGAALTEALMTVEAPTWGIEFSWGSEERTKNEVLGFANMRAECWWRLREALDPEYGTNLAIPDDPQLVADLCSPKWTTRNGKVVIESKADIKKRLGRSPDRGDAVALALKASTMNLERRGLTII